jgi:hypothetical protein
MHPAALPGRSEQHRFDRVHEALVGVRDDQLDPGESPGSQRAQEGGPEGAVFGVTDVGAQDLAVAGPGDPGCDHHRSGQDPAPDAGLDVGGV